MVLKPRVRKVVNVGRLLLTIAARMALAATALLLSIVYHAGTDLGRHVLAGLVSDAVSPLITGDLSIGHFESLSPRGIVAQRVELFDPAGRRVAHGGRLTLVPDLRALFRGQVRFSHARLEEATVWLIDQGDGLPTFISCFDSPNPSPATTEPEGAPIVVDGIEIAHVTLDGDLLGLHGLRAEGVTAGGRLEIGEFVRVRIDRARGTLVKPFGFPGRIDSLTGTISTKPIEGVRLVAAAHRVQEQASATIGYAAVSDAPDAQSELNIVVRGYELTIDTLHRLGFDFLPDLKPKMSGTFRLRGPTDALLFDADVTTDAGAVQVVGRTASGTGTTVSMRTGGLKLDGVLDRAPPLTASGLLRIDAVESALYPTLHAEVEPLLYDRFAIPAFNFDGALTDRGLRIDQLQAQSKTAKLSGHGTIDNDGKLDVKVRARFMDIGTDDNLRRFVPDARGGLDADIAVSTSGLAGDVLRAEGRITLTNLRYESLRADRLELRGRVHGSTIRPEARLQVSGKALSVGEYALGDPKLLVRGGPKHFKAEGQFVTAGRRTFDIQADLTLEKNAVVIDADPIEVVVGDGSWRGALSALRVSEAGLALGLLRLANRSQRLEARGDVQFRGPVSFQAQLQDFDLAAVRAIVGPTFPLSRGRADASLKLTGTLQSPEVELTGALREGELAGIADINAVYLVRTVRGQIDADGEIDLGERGLVQLSGSGHIDPSEPDMLRALRYGSYHLDIGSQGFALALVPAVRAAGVTGQVSGNIHVEGTPQAPELGGRIELRELSMPGWSPLDISADGRYARGQLTLDLALSDERGPLATAGGHAAVDLPALVDDPARFTKTLLDGPWDISGETSERRLDRLPLPLAAALPYPAAFVARFDLRKQGEVSGTLRFDSAWEAALENATCAKTAKPRIRGSLRVEHGMSAVELAALVGPWQVATFALSLETPVDRWLDEQRVTAPSLAQASGRIQVQAMQRVPYLCQFGTGKLDGELELDRGTNAEPLLVAHLSGAFSPTARRREGKREIEFGSCDKDPLQINLELNANGDELAGGGTMTGCHGGKTELDGTFPVEWKTLWLAPLLDMQRDAEATLSFDGAQLKPLLERIPGVSDAEALAHGEVQLQGPLAHPDIEGQVAWSGGSLYLVSTGQELTDIEAGLDFRGNWVKLTHLSAREGRGSLHAEGGIGLDGIFPNRAQLALRLERFPLKQEGVAMAWFTGAAAIDAEIEAERTRAEIKLHNLLARLPDTSNRSLQPLDPHPDVQLANAPDEPPPSAYLIELAIDGRRGIKVERNDFEAKVVTELALSYRDPKLEVGGYVHFNSGEFEVFGKRFTINSGSLRFDGTEEFNPDVYLVATQRPEGGGTSPVTVSVTGTLAEPDMRFSSDACPGDQGAITYLISGQCAADDPDLAQGSADAEGSFAGGLVSGVLTLGAQRELSGLMPRIGVQSKNQNESSVTAGFSSTSLVPKFMRPLVQRVYLQGGLTQSQGQQETPDTEPTPSTSLDFLMELYFPHDLVGAGHFGENSWGLDVTWEP